MHIEALWLSVDMLDHGLQGLCGSNSVCRSNWKTLSVFLAVGILTFEVVIAE